MKKKKKKKEETEQSYFLFCSRRDALDAFAVSEKFETPWRVSENVSF